MIRRMWFLGYLLYLVTPLASAQINTPCTGPCVLTFRYDAARDGTTNAETVLTPNTVSAAGAFGTIAMIGGLHGQIYAQPLFMSGLNSISSKGNVVFVATEQDYVYALDADTYKIIWGTAYLPAGERPINTGTGGDISCTDITPNVGITSTPVIDQSMVANPNPTIYFVTTSADLNGGYHQRLHAVDVTSGAELFGGPVEVQMPPGSSVSFDPLIQLQRSGLTLTHDSANNPQIYIGWGSLCDTEPFHGWVMKFTVQQGVLSKTATRYFAVTSSGKAGGVWGGALAADNPINGNLYVATGNGRYDGMVNFGDTVLKLSSNLALVDWYTPNEYQCLNGISGNSYCPGNTDLGSGGVVLFPVPGGVPELAAAGKQGEIYVIYQSNLGHLDPAAVNLNFAPPPTCTTGPPPPTGGVHNIAQCFPGIVNLASTGVGGGGERGATPAFWNGTLYTAGFHDTLRAFSLSTSEIGTFNTTSAVPANNIIFPYPGASPVISWNGSNPATGIVWVLQTGGFKTNGPAQLQAYAAIPNSSGILPMLYSSGTTGPIAVKFVEPTIANGKVFVAGQGSSTSGTEGRLYIYGGCPCIAGSSISFVQVNAAVPHPSASTVPIAFFSTQIAGDLNIVVIGWNDTTSSVVSVTDTAGNAYKPATSVLRVGSGGAALSQVIYYGANIKGGTNTITVTFNQAAAYPDVRALEYKGVNTLDVTAGATGNSATSSSGPATTSTTNELIVGANTVYTATAAAGSGFTSRIITSPNGDIAEDDIVASTGTYTTTAPLTTSGNWVMQMATFKAGTSNSSPTITSISPTSGPSTGGTVVTIMGTNFASGATVTFGGTAATNVTVSSATSLTATTPAHAAGSVDVVVTINSLSATSTGGFTYTSTSSSIRFVQVNAAVPHPSASTVPIAFFSTQIAGDLNIVVIGWNDTTSSVVSVADTAGNAYRPAISVLRVGSGGAALSQVIYYGANIKGGTNTITVTFNQAAAYPDVRVLEYAGVTTLDATSSLTGNSSTSSSGSVTTTAASELICAANTVYTATTGPGSGFTSRVITSPNGDIAEDEIVSSTGTYTATAPLSASGTWVMQLITFK